MNSSALKKQNSEQSIPEVPAMDAAAAIASETVVKMKTRQQMIAKQSEDACNIPGNICGPELDFFEEKYGITGFA